MASFEQATAGRTTVDRDKPTTDRSGDTAARSTVDREKPTTDRSGDTAARSTVDREKPVVSRLPDPTSRATEDTIVIPGDFRGVGVEIVGPDGERIEQAVWVLTTDLFPTATRVTDGIGTLSLLQTTYSEFLIVGDRPGDRRVDYAWQAIGEATEPIGPQTDEATIVVEPEELRGMSVGGSPSFGGMLR